jgi:hypothetical protein
MSDSAPPTFDPLTTSSPGIEFQLVPALRLGGQSDCSIDWRLASIQCQSAQHTHIPPTRLSGMVFWLVHVPHNSLVLSLTCSHLNCWSTTTIYFSSTLHRSSLYANIGRCWISSPFDKTSFTSNSASSREKTFSTNNHSSWHTVTKLFSQAINNTCHITLLYGGVCYFEWHRARWNSHLCNFIPV